MIGVSLVYYLVKNIAHNLPNHVSLTFLTQV